MTDQFTSQWYDEYYRANPQNFSPWYQSSVEWIENKRPTGKLLEVGCGNGKLLVELLRRKLFGEDQLFGLEQSEVALRPLRSLLPNLHTVNIQDGLPFEDGTFDVVVMTEVIEHLLYPWDTLREIRRVLKPDGILLLSFPNFLNFPWLAIRVLGELLEKTSWTVLQPIDRMYIFPVMSRHVRACGFAIREIRGRVFLPPLLYKYEPPALVRIMNRLGLGSLALHPLLICSKI